MAQTAAIGLGGLLFMVAGVFFFTLSAWLFLLTVTTMLNAALILGAAFFGIGLIFIAVASGRSKTDPRKRKKAAEQSRKENIEALSDGMEGYAGLIAAFINGLNAGKNVRR